MFGSMWQNGRIWSSNGHQQQPTLRGCWPNVHQLFCFLTCCQILNIKLSSSHHHHILFTHPRRHRLMNTVACSHSLFRVRFALNEKVSRNFTASSVSFLLKVSHTPQPHPPPFPVVGATKQRAISQAHWPHNRRGTKAKHQMNHRWLSRSGIFDRFVWSRTALDSAAESLKHTTTPLFYLPISKLKYTKLK